MRDGELTRANTRPVKLRADGDEQRISGYGAVFYRDSEPGTQYVLWGDGTSEGSAVERITRDCEFVGGDVRSMFNHDPNQLLGRQPDTLTIGTDDVGLFYSIPFDDQDHDHRQVQRKIETGKVDGSSFWFRILDESQRTEDGVDVFELKRVQLVEVGPVVMPAYTATTADTRSAHIEDRRRQLAELAAGREQLKERFLQEVSRDIWLLERGI